MARYAERPQPKPFPPSEVLPCEGCSFCGDCRDPGLYVRLGPAQHACSDCWREMGQPGPMRVDPRMIAAHEVRIRERMLARGGSDRHLVRSGKT
jgi:hypothetical protein